MPIVECSALVKTFRVPAAGTLRAVDGVSFSIEAGQIVGLLGPDGAGKTTLLRMLCGLLRPDAGTARVLGFDIAKSAGEIQARIGWMPQRFGLYETLSVDENLALYAGLHGVTRAQLRERSARLLAMTQLEPFRSRRAGKLSGGMKQKLALACALVSEPQLLVLDEPTVGVDIISRRELWGILRTLVDAGKTSVLASTAYMDEADFCDRTITLFRGKILADLPPAQVRAKAAGAVPAPTFEDGFTMLVNGRVLAPPQRANPFGGNAAPVVVSAKNALKKFGDFTAVNHVSFEVRRGEIFGLLGANGAGKTTLFRMLCGLSEPDGGSVSVGGVDLRKSPSDARRKLGFVAQKFSLYSDISTEENLRFFGGAYGLHGEKLRERTAWALESFSLGEFAKMRAGTLPLGIKQRLSMACALLHEPEILFLDEATSGADPFTRRDFWQRISALADRGVAVIITTHFLDEAQFCDRMVVMQSGRVVAGGSVAEICARGNADNLSDAFVNLIKIRNSREREAAAQ